MCGILGGTKPEWNYQAGITSLKHRGPNAQKVTALDNITLAFSRLSIIDLSDNAMQPMSNPQKDVWIVFNGEIYDYKTLRQTLEGRGHQFSTKSDTEVLLKAYLEWDDAFLEHIDGMFAIAVYDQRTMKLKLFRDRVGIKPLYYYFDGKEFAFASELKAFTNLSTELTSERDYTAIYDYLTYMYIPAPKSLYKNISKLPPAHQLEFDLASFRINSIKAYWQVPVPTVPEPIEFQAASEQLRSLIHKSVRDQLVADVPVGAFLSGGMDSSSLVAEISQLREHFDTFCIGFEVDRYSEIPHAKKVADHFRTKHHEKILTATHTENLFDRLKQWFDEPFSDTSAYPTYLVAELAKENVTVVLSADGGDEILGGYTWYHFYEQLIKKPYYNLKSINQLMGRLNSYLPYRSFPWKVFNRFQRNTAHIFESLAQYRGGMSVQEKLPYAKEWGIDKNYDSYWHFRSFYREDIPIKTRIQLMDFYTYLPGDILTKVDRTTMSISLESRVPLLSKDLIEFAFSLPEEIRYYQGGLKGLMRKSYEGILPKSILTREKKGFSIPLQYLKQLQTRKQERILKHLFLS
jgi:asparagine synthase (glutamine-hydrolysing)